MTPLGLGTVTELRTSYGDIETNMRTVVHYRIFEIVQPQTAGLGCYSVVGAPQTLRACRGELSSIDLAAVQR